MDIPVFIAAEARLSFLGVGVKPPQSSWGLILEDCYAFISPTLSHHEIPADQNPWGEVKINGKAVDPMYGWCMCHPFNMLGRCPVLSVPSGIGGNGLPTGIQIVARHLDDARVFHVEQATPWLTHAGIARHCRPLWRGSCDVFGIYGRVFGATDRVHKKRRNLMVRFRRRLL